MQMKKKVISPCIPKMEIYPLPHTHYYYVCQWRTAVQFPQQIKEQHGPTNGEQRN